MALVAPETGRTRTGGRSGPSPDPDFAEAEGAGAVLARFVAALEAERYSGDDSVTLVTFFTRMERLCGAAKALAARRVEEARSHLRSGHRSTAELPAVEGYVMDGIGRTDGPRHPDCQRPWYPMFSRARADSRPEEHRPPVRRWRGSGRR